MESHLEVTLHEALRALEVASVVQLCDRRAERVPIASAPRLGLGRRIGIFCIDLAALLRARHGGSSSEARAARKSRSGLSPIAAAIADT
jgi:hypothetical protein